MEAVLVLYSNREQELNYYRDHISTMCTKYEFSAVMSYDEDRRLEITMNHDSTLFDRSIIAEGENFDITTTKKQRFNKLRPGRAEITWQDGREICINWNRRYCNNERNCNRVHTCLLCKKIGHTEHRCFANNPGQNAAARQNNQTKN